MTKKAIIERTIQTMNQLPEDKVSEISDFADFLSKRYEEELLASGITSLIKTSSAFDFLKNEEDLYNEVN